MENTNDQKVYTNFNYYFEDITEPRQISKIEHKLTEILFITILATIAGCEDFIEIVKYAKQKKDWLSTFLTLPAGIPNYSHTSFIDYAQYKRFDRYH